MHKSSCLVLEEVVVQISLKALRERNGGGRPTYRVGELELGSCLNQLRALRGEVDLNQLHSVTT